MSRVANNPVELPKGVEVTLGDSDISIKGAKGTLAMAINPKVEVVKGDKGSKERVRHMPIALA